MKYIVKEKLWTWGDEYWIRDEQEAPFLQVKGKVFTWGDKLDVLDKEGREVAYIEQKLMSLKPRYRIYREGKLFAELVKQLSWFKAHFELDLPGPNDYTIHGSLFDYEYAFERGGFQVASVSKKLWSSADTYGVDIVEDEDDVAILCTVIAIDLLSHDDKTG